MKIVLGFLSFPDYSIDTLVGLDEALLELRVVDNIIQDPSLITCELRPVPWVLKKVPPCGSMCVVVMDVR
jgi:hypothetical protein